MKRTFTIAILIAVLAALIPASAQAQPRGRLGSRLCDLPTSQIVTMLDRRLDLTDEQQAKIEAVLNEAREGLKEAGKEGRAILEKTREAVLGVLNEEQKAKLGKAKEHFLTGMKGFAEVHGPAMRRGFEGASEEMRVRMAIQSLDLSAEQKSKLQEVQKSMQAKREELQKEIQPKMEQLRKEAMDQVNGVLSEEQRQELKKKLEEMPKPAGGPMLHGRGFGGPKRGPGPQQPACPFAAKPE